MQDEMKALEKMAYKFITPALLARANLDTNGNPIAADADTNDAAPESDAAPARNKGGAPIGNQNARKHGLYAKRLTPEQREALPDFMGAYALVEEVALMRVKLDEFLQDPELKPEVFLKVMLALASVVRINDRIRYGP